MGEGEEVPQGERTKKPKVEYPVAASSLPTQHEAPQGPAETSAPTLESPSAEAAAPAPEDTIDKMIAIVQEREPALLQYLKKGGGAERSGMDAAIAKAQDPSVKADLVRVDVERRVALKDFLFAVRSLKSAKAPELALPEYDVDWVLKQYEAALIEGKPNDAWKIAQMMNESSDQITRPDTSDNKIDWKAKEREGFEVFASNLLQSDPANLTRLTNTIMALGYDKDYGLASDNSSPLAKQLGEKLIEVLVSQGSVAQARVVAGHMKLPLPQDQNSEQRTGILGRLKRLFRRN